MLTRFVRNQLIVFTIASVVGIAVMLFGYMQVPTLLGIGRISVQLDLPSTGGLYQFSNVTYRGVEIGKVTAVKLTETGAQATLVLNTSPKIPADLQAAVRSVSAVGEQYVDLQPTNDSGPYLADGSVIPMNRTSIPQAVGPMLDQVNELVKSLPKDRISDLLDETYKGLNGAAYDFGSLLDSSATIGRDFRGVADQSKTLIDDSGPLLDSQAETADAIRTWARSLAGVTQQISDNDPQIRTLLERGPGFAQEVTGLLDQVKPTLPLLLANLSTLGQVAVKFNPSIEQLLVLLPPLAATVQSYSQVGNSTGLPLGEFSLSVGDPPPCTVGFLPPSSWRNPADTTTIDTPDGIYCKLPQDSPINVRGVRNSPCMGKPGKRAPTVEMCDSDQQFVPLAQREHILGPARLDPNLVSQGIPVDDRVDPGSNLYGPVDGTPLPAGDVPSGTPPEPVGPSQIAPQFTEAPPLGPGGVLQQEPALSTPTEVAPSPAPAPGEVAPQSADGGAQPVAPSGNRSDESHHPSVAFATYNPTTGMYVTPDHKVHVANDLVNPTPTDWTALLPR